jgi:hypothetical protein
MWTALLWIYMANAVLLIIHEIDSAYWKEWDLFNLKGGINVFLLLHIPLLLLVLVGLIQVFQMTMAGLIISITLCGGGIFALCIHTYFIRKGRPEFNTSVSLAILYAAGTVSLLQLILTIIILIK